MGLSMNSLAARPLLAKQLVAQHLVLALPPDAQQLLVEGKIASVPTLATDRSGGANHTILRAAMKGGSSGSNGGSGSSGNGGKQQQQRQLHITDGQGQTAVAVKVVRQGANKVAIIIDRVLMSGVCTCVCACALVARAASLGLVSGLIFNKTGQCNLQLCHSCCSWIDQHHVLSQAHPETHAPAPLLLRSQPHLAAPIPSHLLCTAQATTTPTLLPCAS